MGALADAVLLAAVAVGSVRCAHAMLRANWPRRSPAAAILLWQALGLAGGLAAVGALLAIGVSGPGTQAGVLGGLTVVAGRLASGALIAPHQPAQVMPVLHPQGLIETVQAIEIGPDLGRQGLLLVEGAPGR